MRQLKAFTEKNEAEALSNYLEVEGLENRVRDQSAGWAVWIIHDDDMERAETQLGNWLSQKDALLEDRELSRKASQKRKQREKARRPVYVPRTMRRDLRRDAWGAGVVILVLASVLVAVLSGLGSKPLFALYIAPVDLEQRIYLPLDWTQPWRLLTPIFIHFGFTHILFNMMWLRQLGGLVEQNQGTGRLLGVVVISAVLSNLAQYWLRGPHFGGMSGVNYALFAYVWMYSRYAPGSGYQLSASTTWLMMGWLVLCGTGILGAVANVAHAGGLIVGVILGAPKFVRFVRTYNIKTAFTKGSWEDLHVTGWLRFRRLAIEPYLPLWFLVIALGVVYLDV